MSCKAPVDVAHEFALLAGTELDVAIGAAECFTQVFDLEFQALQMKPVAAIIALDHGTKFLVVLFADASNRAFLYSLQLHEFGYRFLTSLSAATADVFYNIGLLSLRSRMPAT